MFAKDEKTGIYRHEDSPDRCFFLADECTEEALTLKESFSKRHRLYVYCEYIQKDMPCLAQKLLNFHRARPGEYFVLIPYDSVNSYNFIAIPLKTERDGSPVLLSFGGFILTILDDYDTAASETEILFEGRARLSWPGGTRIEMGKISICMKGDLTDCIRFSYSTDGSLREMGAAMDYYVRGALICTYPLEWEQQGLSREYMAYIDIFAPTDENRSFIKLPEGELETKFLCLLSDHLKLKTVAEGEGTGSRLVFQREFGLNQRLYLSFSGAFLIENEGKYLPGFQGMEYIKVEKGDILSFFPNKAACVDEGTGGLTDDMTVPYIGVSSTYAGYYYTQSAEWPFFLKSTEDLWDFYELPFARLHHDYPIPIIVGGAEEGLIHELDQIFLSPARRRIMSESIGAYAGTGTYSDELIQVENEQGLRLRFSEASLAEDQLAEVSFSEDIVWERVTKKLKAALLAGDGFLVMADAAAFYENCAAATMKCQFEDWKFSFAPEEWEAFQMLVIVKQTGKQSIVECCKKEGIWSYRDENSRERIRLLVENRLPGYEKDEDYRALYEILNDPLWCGMLVFNARMDMGRMAPELRFLEKGIPKDVRQAQYLAFGNRGKTGKGLIKIQQLDGFPDKDQAYGFCVNILTVHFQCACVEYFRCRLQLLINRVFGARTMQAENEGNSFFYVDGVLERENGEARYRFFLEEEAGMSLPGTIIEGLVIRAVSVLILDETVRFSMEGNLYLENPYEGFDLYSYGFHEENEAEGGIFFSNLYLQMEGDVFSCPFVQTVLSVRDSVPREGSFGETIPMYPTGLIYHAQDGITPASLGFSGVGVDSFVQKELSGEWLGICFSIPLGGLGALAKAVDMKLKLLMAFSADEKMKLPRAQREEEIVPPARYVGMKLGEGAQAGGSGFSLDLQGIMKLCVQSVELKKQERGYGILLRDTALKLLKITAPPGGNSIFLFGEKGNGRLAWFAEYEKDGGNIGKR